MKLRIFTKTSTSLFALLYTFLHTRRTWVSALVARFLGIYTEGSLLSPVKNVTTFVLMVSLMGLSVTATAQKYVKVTATGSGNGSSWDNALGAVGLKATIEAGGTVYIAAGTYNPTATITLNGTTHQIIGGFAATATGTSLSTYNPATNQTIISASAMSAGVKRVFYSTSLTVELKGLVLQDGAQGTTGGAVYVGLGKVLKFTDLVIKNNTAGGIGVYSVTGATASVAFTNCIFTNNSNAGNGGALVCSTVYENPDPFAIAPTAGKFTMTNCSFDGNTSANQGGAIEFTTSHAWEISGTCFSNNAAALAGGVIFTTSKKNALTNCNFTNNAATTAEGGAIIATTASATLTNCNFVSNTATGAGTGYGGAIFATTASLTLSGTKFYNNLGKAGGAIYSTTWTNNLASAATNCVFSNNAATNAAGTTAGTNGGGAMVINANANAWNFNGCTFANNTVPTNGWGGAISHYDAETTFNNTVFYNNTKGGVANVSGSDIKNYDNAGHFNAITNCAMQLASAAYTNQAGATDAASYGFGTGNTFNNVTNPNVAAAPTISCPTALAAACATPSVGGVATYSGGTVCSTSNVGTITLTGQTGNVVTWQTSTNGGTTWTDVANTLGKTSYNFINAANNQQFRAVVNANITTCTDDYSSVVTITTSAAACATTTCSYTSSSFSPTISTSSNPTYTTHVILVNPTTGVMNYVTAANSTAFTGVALGDYIMYAVTYDNTMSPTPTISVGANIMGLTGCTSISDALLTKVCCPTIAAPTVTITQPSCGVTTGSITITNPTSGVTYSFDNGTTFQTLATKSGLTAATTYQVVTKDNATACLSPATPSVLNAILAVPNAPTTTVTQPTCSVTTGTITVTTPSSGVTYSFDNGTTFQALATSNALTTGTYQVKVKDNASNCASASTPSVINAVLAVPSAPTTTVAQPICGATTGTITVTTPTNGVTYSFDNGTTFQAAATSNALTTGTYQVIVKDNTSACASTATPSVLNAILAVPSAPTTTIAQPTCSTTTGTITVTTPSSVTYSFDNGTTFQAAATSNALTTGTYQVKVKDNASNCVSTSTPSVINAPLNVPTAPTNVTVVNQPTCATATSSVSMNGMPSTGTWTLTRLNTITSTSVVITSNGSGPTFNYSGVPSGTYTYTVTDNASTCISPASNSIIVNPQPVTPSVPTLSVTQPTCTNATGTLTITQPTDVGMTYSIDGTTYTNTTGIFSNVASGTYNVTAKSSGGCVSPSASATINAVIPAPTVTIVQPSCTVATGSFTVISPVGSGFSYSVDLTDYSNTSGVFSGLAPATYNVTAKNGSGCVSAATPVVILPPVPAPIIATNQPNCTTATGTITITTPSSGVTYSFNNGVTFQISNVLTNVAPATYQIVIKNTSDGCVTSPKDVIVSPPPTVGCNCGNETGTITAIVSNQNTSTDYTQVYALTDNAGVIIQTSATPTFTGLTTNQYAVYALNYKNTEGAPNLAIGQNIANANAPCLDVSAPLFYKVCIPVFNCNNASGTITAVVSGQNTNVGFTQSYALTDSVGVILRLANSPTFAGLVNGRYKFYGVNYDAAGVTGLTIGQNINAVAGVCFAKTAALLYQVCIVPEICNNRIDDDGDGLIDCEDVTDCPACGCDNATGDLTFTNTNYATTGYTQVYALTDSTGKILKTNAAATFTGLSSGRYRVYAINYRTADGITGVAINANINGVTGTCFDKSLPLLFKVCLCVTMNVKVMLEGPFVTASSTMQTILNDRGLLPGQTPIGQFAVATPQGQPYKGLPWNYAGTEGDTVTTYPATVVDWVLVTLRKDTTTTDSVFRVTGWLHNDGHISFISPCFDIANGGYYVVIEHRNHVGVMSPNKVLIVNGVMTHDFTINDSYITLNPPSFGQKQRGSKWTMYAGDGKKDTKTTNYDVNANDNQYWKLQSGIFDQYRNGDYNMDADVNFNDSYLWKFNSGKYSGVPH